MIQFGELALFLMMVLGIGMVIGIAMNDREWTRAARDRRALFRRGAWYEIHKEGERDHKA